jgi:hypothetical protein
MGKRSAKSVGASPPRLYIYVESVDKVVEKATKLGGFGALNRVRRGEAKTVSEAASQASAEDPSFSLHSGSMIWPAILKLPLADGASVAGCPPPIESVYSPSATMISPVSVTMLRSRGFNWNSTF